MLPEKIKQVTHFVIPRLSGWIRAYNGTAAPSSYIETAYLGKASYGSALVQSIVDIRSSFISGGGLNVYSEQPESNQDELDYINSVLTYNQIDELLNNLAVTTEIDAKLLAVLEIPSSSELKTEKVINIKVLPYSIYNYVIDQNEDDLQIIDKITYTSNGKKEEIENGEFVYRNFGSSLWYKPQTSSPRIASVVEYIQNIDRVMLDLREINHLFASPTPYFKCEDQSECQALYTQIRDQNWSIGKSLITTADYSLVEIGTNTAQSIEKEVVMLMEKVSGTTGVPIYFLGMSRLLNNRATAIAMLEQLENSVSKERKILESWFNELFYLILTYSNKYYKTDFNVNSVKCNIVKPPVLEVDEQILTRLMDLYDKKAISLETILKYVPEVEDPQEEISRLDNTNGVLDNA